MKTKALILKAPNKYGIEEIDIPKLKDYQLLVKIIYTSLCGSTVSQIRGERDTNFYPCTVGHEGYGEVVDNGGSAFFKNGDKVIISWIKNKIHPESGTIKYGEVNSGQCSTLIEYAVVSKNRLYKYYNKLTPSLIPFLGCAIPTALNAIWSSEGDVLFLGLGGVGACAAAYSHITDRLGTFYGFDIDENKIAKSGLEPYNGQRLDYIVDFTGNEKAFYEYWPKTESNYMLVGNYNKRLSIDPMDFIRGKRLSGVSGDSSDLHEIIHTIDCLGGVAHFRNAAGKRYKFEDVGKAIRNFGKELKPIIKM